MTTDRTADSLPSVVTWTKPDGSQLVWRGTWQDFTDLERAARQLCPDHRRVKKAGTCGACLSLSQREWDGLLFGRHLAPQLRTQEFALA
jgi:hypothetical protein